MFLKHTILIFACFLFSLAAHSWGMGATGQGFRQESQHNEERDSVRTYQLHRVLSEIQEGIVKSDVGSFASSIAPQVYVSLLNSDEGYFSSNQSSFVIQHFLSSNRILTFRFTTIQSEGSSGYATGGGTIVRRGSPEIIQVYVALKYQERAWILTQFNIY